MQSRDGVAELGAWVAAPGADPPAQGRAALSVWCHLQITFPQDRKENRET